MNRFEQIYHVQRIGGVSTAIDAIKSIDGLSWEDCYWISKTLYVYGADAIDDSEIIPLIDTAFAKGLNYHSNAELYLDCAQMMARLYMKYKRYDEAINFLMSVDELSDNALDWVHLYYALAQVLSSNIVRIAQNPKFFFSRLDKVSQKSVAKRNEVFITYLQQVREAVENGFVSAYAKETIEEKAKQFDLLDKAKDCLQNLSVTGNKTVEQAPQDSAAAFQSIIDSKNDKIDELAAKVAELEDTLSELLQENERLKTELKNKDNALVQIRTSSQDNGSAANQPQEDFSIFNNNGHALLNKYQKNQKILVIGEMAGSSLSQIKLRAKRKGFDEDKDFDFITDYDKITGMTGQINYNRYAAIIAGPMGHSTAGNDGYSSFIGKLKGEGYTTLYEARTESGKLKLNQSSFDRALQKFISKLLVM